MKRGLLLAAGLVALAAAWLSPLPQLAAASFAAHMSMHVTVVAAAAPLIAGALAGSRWDPSVRWPALFAPLLASLIELLVVWGWHAPALHALARHSSSALAIEQASFLAAGLLLWIGALGGTASQRLARAAAGVVALLLTSMHMTLLGALLALAPRALYVHAEVTSALPDQQLGGVIMLAAGGVAYLIGGLGVAARLLRGDGPPVREAPA